MRQALKLHPDSPAGAARAVEADVERLSPSTLRLRYRVTGDISGLLLPPPQAPERTDGLWQHTCFEAFLRSSPGPGYAEFNFAPSSQWAAYRFDDYRSAMRVAGEIGPPPIQTRFVAGQFELEAALALAYLRGLQEDALWRLGVSAVIEEKSGRKSFWALAHPPGEPDFHHQDCFVLELPPPQSG